MGAGSATYDLVNAYEALLEALDQAASQANCGFLKKTEPLTSRFSREADSTVFNCFLHLQGWKARKNEIHILIHIQETIKGQKPNYMLMKSTVNLNYFTIKDDKAHLLHGIHFDYGPEEESHPIFHAQLANELIALPTGVAEQIEFVYPTVGCSECFKASRIPTSDMTIASVLLCLAADHFGPSFFPGFLKQVTELQERLPQPTFEKTRQSLQAVSKHLRSSHWYAHECS